MEFTAQVANTSVLRQAVLNTSSSIELLREAVSNSVDADARNIAVQLTNVAGDVWQVVIQDDGHGMEERHMKAFFNTGETQKDNVSGGGPTLSIGEKGLGSKTSFVAKSIHIESRRRGGTDFLVGHMNDPMKELRGGRMPTYVIEASPSDYEPNLLSSGTRITLEDVHIAKFNGKVTQDPDEIARRVMHYLRTMCATGTVKNRHAAKTHVIQTVFNVNTIPQLTVEVSNHLGVATLGPVSGSYNVPNVNITPSGGTTTEGVAEDSKLFCNSIDFARSKTLVVQGQQVTVHYDGTAIVAGDEVRTAMLKDELRQGLTHKSQMGVHLCKDFIPMKTDNALSRELLHNEYYYEYKVFLNCQAFELNADRNTVTNSDSSEISWIWEDFRQNVWPSIETLANPYNVMKQQEAQAIEAAKRTREAAELKAAYGSAPAVSVTKPNARLKYVKSPKKEADVSHLLAMMVQSGKWSDELDPIEKFGQYIDASTDVLVEDGNGSALLVEIETSLPNLHRHQHPMASYDLVVVWDLGSYGDHSTFRAPWGSNGSMVTVSVGQEAASGRWFLQWGTTQKRVIVLKDIL